MNHLLKLIIFLTLCCAVLGQCERFIIYDGEVPIETSTICIRKYKTAECINFYNSFDQSKLPPGFPRSAQPIEGPSKIHVTGIDTPIIYDGENYLYPGLSIQWWPPKSENARKACYGYLVVWFVKSGTLTMCQLFHIKATPKASLHFRYDIPKVIQLALYEVRVYSMPPVSYADKDNNKLFASTQIKSYAAYQKGVPAKWAPFVAYSVHGGGLIRVTISLPPAEFNITDFILYLEKDDSPVPVKTIPFTAPLMTSKEKDYSLELVARESGAYRIVIWAVDKYRYRKGMCQCWEWQNNEKECRNSCGGTRTEQFHVDVAVKETEYPSPFSHGRTGRSTMNRQAGTIGATLMGVLSLAILAVAVFVIRNKNKERQSPVITRK